MCQNLIYYLENNEKRELVFLEKNLRTIVRGESTCLLQISRFNKHTLMENSVSWLPQQSRQDILFALSTELYTLVVCAG